MSSITGLISAGGGGGASTNIITDPKKFDKYGIQALGFKTNNTANGNSLGQVPESNSAHTAYVAVTASDTYATVLDITSSDGGYLHWVLSCGINTLGETATIKITVDGGTPVELTYNPPVMISQRRMFIGGGLQIAAPNITTTYSTNNDTWNTASAFGGGSSPSPTYNVASFDDTTNNVYGIGHAIAYLNPDISIRQGMPYQKLEFGSTLKVEAKMSTYTTVSIADYATCFYTLF